MFDQEPDADEVLANARWNVFVTVEHVVSGEGVDTKVALRGASNMSLEEFHEKVMAGGIVARDNVYEFERVGLARWKSVHSPWHHGPGSCFFRVNIELVPGKVALAMY